MTSGGQRGNTNALKDGLSVMDRAAYMRKYRKDHPGYKRKVNGLPKGRPRKPLPVKGDIFDVAAKLAKALKAYAGMDIPGKYPHQQTADALLSYYNYWEND